MPGQLLGNANGGMTVYYSQPSNGKKVTAFKKVAPNTGSDTYLKPDSYMLGFSHDCWRRDDAHFQ